MNTVSAVVYILSPYAIATLMKGNPLLDMRLRTVLALVDGVSPVVQFEPFLKEMEPIDEAFVELEHLGYLLRVGSVSDAAVAAFRGAVDAGDSIFTLPPIDAQSPDSGFVPLR
jgi:hypothetical protein